MSSSLEVANIFLGTYTAEPSEEWTTYFQWPSASGIIIGFLGVLYYIIRYILSGSKERKLKNYRILP